ncbi:MAG: hypothetical protein H7175_08505 [Burkholderiales bacterium]|nr:hypothetical protein [Anaerolineae bacterium]
MSKINTVLLLVVVALLSACGLAGTPSGSNTDAGAAQRFLPTINGYTQTDANNVREAISSVGEGATAIIGRPEVSLVIDRIDSALSCYNNVGAVAARVYTQADLLQLAQGELPKIGALAVVNEQRLIENLLACAVNPNGFSAQAAAIEPCGGSGRFAVGDENISYVYVATTPELCATFENSFAQYQ